MDRVILCNLLRVVLDLEESMRVAYPFLLYSLNEGLFGFAKTLKGLSS